MKLKKCLWFLIIIMVLFLPGAALASGLSVGPDEIYLENVPLGKPVAVSKIASENMKLSIKNKGASACSYNISILSSGQTTAPLSAGYVDIPDVSWIYPENKEIRIEGNSTKTVELYLKIPKNKAYDNKRYQAVIDVKSKKNRADELFVLACQLKILFSTSAGGKNEKP